MESAGVQVFRKDVDDFFEWILVSIPSNKEGFTGFWPRAVLDLDDILLLPAVWLKCDIITAGLHGARFQSANLPF